MIRVKKLHALLWEYIARPESSTFMRYASYPSHEISNRRSFTWNEIIKNMSVGNSSLLKSTDYTEVYLQVIGRTSILDGLENCVAQGLSVNDSPPAIR